jgi:predicted RNA binding protein YcfA (HicA-like mRNA interferase family)
MGKLPLLTPREVEANLKACEFVHKRTVGSHKAYERPASADGKRKRAIVTVDVGKKQFDQKLMASMIRQSLLTREEFCTGILKKPETSARKTAQTEESENA